MTHYGFLLADGAIVGDTTAMFHGPEANAIVVLAGNQASNFSNATTEIAIQLAALCRWALGRGATP